MRDRPTGAGGANRRSGAAGVGLAVAVVLAAGLVAAAKPLGSADAEIPGDTQASERAALEATTVDAPDPQEGGRWGERLAAAGDLNGDGVPDVFVGAPLSDAGGVEDAGRVYAVSGADRSVLYTLDSPEPQEGAAFGFFVSVPGDLDGDDVDDLAVGANAQDVATGEGPGCGEPEPNGCNEKQGKAWAFSGADGALLYAMDNPQPQGSEDNPASFGARLGRAGDVTGDGVADHLVGASNNDVPAGCGDEEPVPEGCRVGQGQAFVMDGADGQVVRTLNLPEEDAESTCGEACGSFGLAVQGPGDVDGDGVTDQYVNAGSFGDRVGRSYVFSGDTGELVRTIEHPQPQEAATFGFQDVEPLAPGDVDGDGVADLYASGLGQDGEAEAEGRAWVFSGATGEVLYALRDPSPAEGGQFGWSMSPTDFDADGETDLYVGSSPRHGSGTQQHGGAYVFDGEDGSLLASLELPEDDLQSGEEGNPGPSLGWASTAPGDLTGDGLEDYVAAAPFLDVDGAQDQGRVYVFSSTGACPAGRIPSATFTDTAGTTHEQAIDCLAYYGVARGATTTLYAPSGSVRRDQMASFVARALATTGVGLPEPSDQGFGDVDGNPHRAAIDQLAELGVVQGVTAQRYAPDERVRRDQMATFLVSAYEHLADERLPEGDPPFTDVEGNTHETTITKAHEAGFALGTSETTYEPANPVRRDQMASFLARLLERAAASRTLRAADPAPSPDPAQPAEQPGFATTGGVTLHEPSTAIEVIGFHQSNHDGAQQLEPLPSTAPTITLETRHRPTPSRSAADIVLHPEQPVRAPVSGTVVRAGTYVLYCDYRDDFAVIEPDDHPGWEVKLLHIDGVRVRPGDRVEAGTTILAGRPTPLPFESQVDEYSADRNWPHVHLEVIDPSIPDEPSGSC